MAHLSFHTNVKCGRRADAFIAGTKIEEDLDMDLKQSPQFRLKTYMEKHSFEEQPMSEKGMESGRDKRYLLQVQHEEMVCYGGQKSCKTPTLFC